MLKWLRIYKLINSNNEEEQFDIRFKILFICYAISFLIFSYISIKEVIGMGI